MAVQKVFLLNQNTPVNIPSGLVPKGAYNGATDYAVGDSVDYNGSSYVMFVDAAAGTLPTDTTKWQVLANKGATGSPGSTGQGVPTGGTANQVLAKIDGTDFNTQWSTPSGCSGNAATATKLAATKNINGTPFDGSADIRSDSIQPSDHNLLAWNFDPLKANNAYLLPTAGTLMVFRIFIPKAMTISNILLSQNVVGNTITNGYVALYQNNTLLAQSANQASDWNATTGIKTIAIAPQEVVAGSVEVVVWCGSWVTAPSFHRAAGQASYLMNVGLSAANSRCATADTGKTTTAPNSLGTHSPTSVAIWVGLS